MSAELPLSGLLVADFSRVLAGPFATMALADLGATVVKVERPGTGDDTRAWGPPWTPHSSAYFACLNRGKRSVALDLADPGDREVAVKLVRRADVLVENFRPGALARYGLDYATARELNPRLVYTSISGFGSGTGAHLPGYDFVVQAAGGLMSITGSPEGEPTKVGVALVDVLTGKDALTGILAALRHRDRTGRGQHVEVNLMSSLLGALVNQVAGYLATGESPARDGNRHPSIAPYEALRCADGHLVLAVGNDQQFRVLAAALGRPEWADDPRFATNPARVAHHDELVGLLEPVLAERGAADWERDLRDAGVACAQVNDVGAAVDYAAALGLDPLLDLGDGHPPQIRLPITFSESAVATPTPPPALGQHDAEVRAWLATPATSEEKV
ncbi:CaiB/BaiF CoA transferase family protein [Gandjariella thermophila]|uniref:CoA transferase n=1 Tax=Gandjariella thermophila TaxID=1931992 RepID=A0A4D4IYY1_9PSEU|nr:CoA transferase [Gandjariella thermophila]GDY29555.1 CoA transferase [Gandjariella thermophila]